MHLGEGVYTYEADRPDFAKQAEALAQELRAFLQTVADVVRRPLESLRVLDLACLEGLYGLEFALHGAEVVLLSPPCGQPPAKVPRRPGRCGRSARGSAGLRGLLRLVGRSLPCVTRLTSVEA